MVPRGRFSAARLVSLLSTCGAPALLLSSAFLTVGCQTARVYRTLVVPIEHRDLGPWSVQVPPRHSAQEWQAVFDGGEIPSYFEEVSYGASSVDIRVLQNPARPSGWFAAAKTPQDYIQDPSLLPAEIFALLTSLEIDLDAYDGIVFFGNATVSSAQTAWRSDSKGKPRTVIFYNEVQSDAAVTSTLTHELVHVISYVDQLETDLDLYGWGSKNPDGTLPASCGATRGCASTATTSNPDNYADWDLMGDHSALTHPSLRTKRELGWIGDAKVQHRSIAPSAKPFHVSMPLAAMGRPSSAAFGVALQYTEPGAPFAGYYVECRRRIGRDASIPEEGLLVTEIGTGACNRPARVVSGPPLQPTSTCAAALNGASEATESWVDAQRGLVIQGAVQGKDRCNVELSFSNSGQPDLAFSWPKYWKQAGSDYFGSVDIWIDTPAFGDGGYPPQQTVDAMGAPSGQGDFPAAGVPAKVYFRLHNLGTADAHGIEVELTAEEFTHATVSPSACSPGEPGSPTQPEVTKIGASSIERLRAGESVIRAVSWTPAGSGGRQIKVRVVDFDESGLEINKANNTSRESVVVSYPGVTEAGNLEQDVVIKNPCLADRLTIELATPLPFPQRPVPDPTWVASLSTFLVTIPPLEEARIDLRVTPPTPRARGYFAVPLRVRALADPFVQEAEIFEPRQAVMELPPVLGWVLDRSSVSCAVADTAEGAVATGRLGPALGGESILVKVHVAAGQEEGPEELWLEGRTSASGEFSIPISSRLAGNPVSVVWTGNQTAAGAAAECLPAPAI